MITSVLFVEWLRDITKCDVIDAHTCMVVYCVIKLDYKKFSETKRERKREKEWRCFAEEIKRANKEMAS